MKSQSTLARWILPLFLALLAFGWPSDGRSATLPGDVAIGDFERTRDYAVRVDGEDVDSAVVYVSRAAVADLVIADGLPLALLVSPRGRSVQTVGLAEVRRGEAGDTASLPAGVARLAGEYEKRLGVRRFEVAGHAVEISDRPPLLGRRLSSEVETRHPAFRRIAAAVAAKSAPAVRLALPDEPVRVRVYFASWSPICERMIPKILHLERSLAGRVSFEYYGLPKPLDADPVVREQGISGVPTLVVHAGGEELGRLAGRELDEPGPALARLLDAR